MFDSKVTKLLRSEYRIKFMTKVSASTLEELAGKLEGVNPESFLKTVSEFNAALIERCAQDIRAALQRGAAVMLITHDMGVIAEACDRVGVMYAGRLVEVGAVQQVIHAAHHPYSRGLMASIPSTEVTRERAHVIALAALDLDAQHRALVCDETQRVCHDRARVERTAGPREAFRVLTWMAAWSVARPISPPRASISAGPSSRQSRSRRCTQRSAPRSRR